MRKMISTKFNAILKRSIYIFCLTYALIILIAELLATTQWFDHIEVWRVPDAEYHLFYLIYLPVFGLLCNYKRHNAEYIFLGMLSVYLIWQVKIWLGCVGL